MKRIVPSPALPNAESLPWRSEGERQNTPEFRSAVLREFEDGADELELDETSRRSFLKVMGGSMALAGLGLAGCRRPEKHLVPYTKTPEWLIPGKSVLFATTMPRRNGGWPLLVSTFDARPTKIEGNPTHPASNGSTDLFAQASILDLYDPSRSRTFLHSGKASTAETFDQWLTTARAAWAANGGAGLAFLVDEAPSPTRDRLRAEISAQFPNALWAEYEPLADAAATQAVASVLGTPGRLLPQLDKAKVVLSLGADFLGTEATLGSVPKFSKARRVRESAQSINRLYVAENRFSLTGGMADHRLRLAAGLIPALAVAVAREVGGEAATLAGKLADRTALLESAVDPLWIKACAEDLVKHKGSAVVLAGSWLPAPVQALVLAINQALGAFDQLLPVVPRATAAAAGLETLVTALNAGSVKTLFILGGNPAYNAPAALKWAEAQAKAESVVRLSLLEDETTQAGVTWHVPAAHYLEAWGDALSEDGTYCSIQPMILPLFGGWSELDLLARVAGQPKPAGPELVKATFEKVAGSITEKAWSDFVHDGFLKDSAKRAPAAFNAGGADTLLAGYPASSNPVPEALELVLAPAPTLDDGRFATNAWLQEVPDPVTKLTWDNALLVSPATARTLGISGRDYTMSDKKSDVVKVTVGGVTVTVPALISPGHADNSVTLSLGFGRTLPNSVAEGAGVNAYPLLRQAGAFVLNGAKIEKTSDRYKLAITQEHQVMENRFTFREATVDYFEGHKDFAKHLDPLPLEMDISAYPHPPLTDQHQWAMVIDLQACTGCNACVVACQSENNIPVVGKEQVLRNREMQWIRSDVYYVGTPEDPSLGTQPVPCMHCENAPCETVCPVNATVHSEDGLNVMAYNRCIGTRYCANNCPFKVRRFNYFDFNLRPVFEKNNSIVGRLFGAVGKENTGQDGLYQGPFSKKGMAETLKLQKNPNVTVRMRGVIEKCTFCVQRIETAKIENLARIGASRNNGVPTDSFQVACQQACPAEAITFGNKSDANAQVTKLLALPQNYTLLDYLNIKSRVSYLARVRNPNLMVPGAEEKYSHAEQSGAPLHSGHGEGHGDAHGDGHGGGHGGSHGHGEAPEEIHDPHGTEGQRGGL